MPAAGLLMLALLASRGFQEVRSSSDSGQPSLDGLWTTSTLTPFERPDELKALVLSDDEGLAYERKHRGKPPEIPDDAVDGANSEWWENDVGLARIRGRLRGSWIVSPADGKTPLSDVAKAQGKARRDRFKSNYDDPEARPDGERCLETGGPPLMSGDYNNGFKIVQTARAVVIFTEWMNDARIVRTDGSGHPPPHIRGRRGDSIGWWEGATLVVETTNFDPAVVRSTDGNAAADMRVMERFTRAAPDELHYTFMISNPGRFIQPLQGEMVFRATSQPIFEFACHEGNYSLRNVLGGRDAGAQGVSREATP